jgi:beta-glucosidase/6-phospho-beta-glucosidase/beta-galactosidase
MSKPTLPELFFFSGFILIGVGLLILLASVFIAPASRPTTKRQVGQEILIEFPQDFLFGLATAPAHIEDQLNDGWLEFAKRGRVRAWKNQAHPEERLRFWSEPETEIELAARTGVKVFRLGVDWSRLCPLEPDSTRPDGSRVELGVQDFEALDHYAKIMTLIKDHGMQPMVTLFHHSLPPWSIAMGGWTNPKTKDYFVAFCQDVVRRLAPLVDYWITFNEPNTFTLLTYIAGVWPPGLDQTNYTGMVELGPFDGSYPKSLQNMTSAHNALYPIIKKLDPGSKIGIAHLVSENYAQTFAELPMVLASRYIVLLNDFPDRVISNLDFLGINYYGEEVVQGDSIAFVSGREYSDSGRAIFPEGLYRVLMHFHQRYNSGWRWRSPLPFWITENGIADENDVLRPAYLIEHLIAVNAAMQQGVPVHGYIFWTISDNWEWHDGYGPKFGLVAVDRKNNLARSPRASYYLFQRLVTSKMVTNTDRLKAWNLVQQWAGKSRPLWRSEDGRLGLEEARPYVYSGVDWRFPDEPRIFDHDWLQLFPTTP